MSSCRGLHWSLVILGLLSVGPMDILAQTSEAVCLDSFNWMDNSKDQSPCLVAAYLQGACNGGEWDVPAIQPGTYYAGPDATENNPCQCSSVTYNTISACGLCQNCTIITWSSWNFNCTAVYPGVFLPSIPDGTAVPQWAFQDVTSSDMFNVATAQAVGDIPESTVSNVQSTGSSIATSTSASAQLTVLPSTSGSTSVPASSSGKPDTGVIIGGIVGGAVGVTLIAGVVVFFVTRKERSQTLSSAQFVTYQTSPPAMYTNTTSFSPQMVQLKLYDLSDTFPVSSPLATSINHPPSLRPGWNYNGAPGIRR